MLPVRMIMNNKTLTILEGVDYENQIATFILKQSTFKHSLVRKQCFIIEDDKAVRLETKQKLTFCPFGITNSADEWVNELRF
jgi:hypothetical protein